GQPDVLLLAVAQHLDVHRLARWRVGHDARQRAVVEDRLAVESEHHVAVLQSGLRRGAIVVDAGNQRARRTWQAHALRDFGRDLLDADANPTTARGAILLQLPDDVLHEVRRDREADTYRPARWREDGGIHADDIAVHVEQRATGIAAIDRRVGLDEIVVGTGVDVAIARRHDARRHGRAEAERIADGDHPIADARVIGIAEPG